MRRACGLDINGWKDIAARDWDAEDSDSGVGAAFVIEGGIGSVAVKQGFEEWIGGPQANLAPHGRGPGWGDLGASAFRVALAPYLDDLQLDSSSPLSFAYPASVNALARNSEEILLTIPDLEDCDERARTAILSLFRNDRRQVRLLWKPVACFLHALDCGAIKSDADRNSYRFLIHSGKGIEVQTLRLRRDEDNPGHVAPEREGYGSRVLGNLGLRKLLDRADDRLRGCNPILAAGFCDASTLGLRLICGRSECGDVEIVRLNNGNWSEIVAPEIEVDDIFGSKDFDADVDPDSLNSVDSTFLVTPLAPNLASALAKGLAPRFSDVTLLGWDAAARGALRAARLIQRNLPHYFDRLTPIRLAVLKGADPQFDDLIGGNATLPANREYRSAPYRNLKCKAGKHQLDFYVLKGEQEIRFWSVPLAEAPRKEVGVELQIRQTPGQSWAKLSLTSAEWEPLQRSPILLDWANLHPLDETPDEILERLKSLAVVPIRITEEPSMIFWEGWNSGRVSFEPLIALLERMEGSKRDDFLKLANLLAGQYRDSPNSPYLRPIGTDGQLPDQLTERHREHLDAVLGRCTENLVNASRRPIFNNDALRCLTWAFTRCPDTVQDMIVDATEAYFERKGHSLLLPKGGATVVVHGAGRSVTGADRLRRVLVSLVKPDTRSMSNRMKSLAMILSRREEAPRALTPDIVERIADFASKYLVSLSEKRSFKIAFRNALSAIAGLFRYREVMPSALLSDRDPAAKRLGENLVRAEVFLQRELSHERGRGSIRNAETILSLIESIHEFLDGRGDAAILLKIENMEENDEDEEQGVD